MLLADGVAEGSPLELLDAAWVASPVRPVAPVGVEAFDAFTAPETCSPSAGQL